MYYYKKTSQRHASHLKHSLRVLGPPTLAGSPLNTRSAEFRQILQHESKLGSPQQATPLPTLYSIVRALRRPMALRSGDSSGKPRGRVPGAGAHWGAAVGCASEPQGRSANSMKGHNTIVAVPIKHNPPHTLQPQKQHTSFLSPGSISAPHVSSHGL